MKNVIKKAIIILLALVMVGPVTYVPCGAVPCGVNECYEEKDIDSAKKVDSNIRLSYINNQLNLKYQIEEADKKQNSYFKLRQNTYKKKKKVTKLYYGSVYYWNDYMSDTVVAYGKLKYCFSQNKKKKQINVTVYNGKMKKISQSTFSIANWIDKKVMKNKGYCDTNYNLECSELKVISKNKVQLLYALRNGNDYNQTYYGGVAVLNLKTNKVISNKRLSFAPYKSDDTYIYGSDCIAHDLGRNRKLYIAKRKTGKVLKTYQTDYGVDYNVKDQYLVCENPECEMESVGAESSGYTGLAEYDFYKGQVIIVNYSGIYLGSAKIDGMQKIADLSDLNYYTNHYKQQMIYKIALKSKSEFSIVYADSWDYPNIAIKKYKTK